MEVEDDKPFVCSQNGCGQKFTNEDHLAVHMRKHEMSLALNLAGGSNSINGRSPNSLGPPGLFLDQTPTPTKFLKNCEEIGLFQELKNPFEEAFKKALDPDGHPEVPSASPFPGPTSNELNTPIPPIPKTVEDIKLEPQESDNMVALNLSKTQHVFVRSHPSSTTNSESDPLVIDPSTKDNSDLLQSDSPAQVVPSSSASPTLLVTAAQSTTFSPPKTTTPTATPVIQQPQYATCMQVFLQLPSGQTVPVQIPATITTPNVQQVIQSNPSNSLPAVASGLLQKLNSSPVSGLTVPQVPPVQQQIQNSTASQSILLQSPVKQQPQQAATTPQGQTSITKQRLKAALQQQTIPSPSSKPSTSAKVLQVSPDINNPNQITVISSTTNHVPSTSPMSVETSSIASDSASSPDADPSGISLKRYKKIEDDPDDRRKKFLERNRAAAARCRQKRKHWITNLEKKGDELQSVNTRLQSEVNSLKTEVAQLKTLLLAHKDCPITQQQKSQGQFPLQAFSVMDTTATSSMETSTMVATEPDDELVTVSGTSWVTTPTVIKTVAPVTTATVTMATGQQKTITIIPKVIKTESTKPIRKK